MEFKKVAGKSDWTKEKIESVICSLCNGWVSDLVFPVEVEVLLEVISNNGAEKSADFVI